MSRGVFYIRDARYGVGTGNTELVDAITEGQFRSQPQEVYGSYNMGATAENIALEYGITRQEQDEFSFASQQKAILEEILAGLPVPTEAFTEGT